MQKLVEADRVEVLVLVDNATDLITAKMPDYTREEKAEAAIRAARSCVAVGLTGVPTFARVSRAQVLSLRRRDVAGSYLPRDRMRVARFGEREFASDGATLFGEFNHVIRPRNWDDQHKRVKTDRTPLPATASPSNEYCIASDAVSTTRPCPAKRSCVPTPASPFASIPRANAADTASRLALVWSSM